MGYVGLRDHRSHRLCDVFVDKPRLDVGVEYGAEVLIRFLVGGRDVFLLAQWAFVPSATSILNTEKWEDARERAAESLMAVRHA
jgi:hypothetical protein